MILCHTVKVTIQVELLTYCIVTGCGKWCHDLQGGESQFFLAQGTSLKNRVPDCSLELIE
jgi:hypothetical protein